MNSQDSELSDGHCMRFVCLIFIFFLLNKKKIVTLKLKMVLNHVFHGLTQFWHIDKKKSKLTFTDKRCENCFAVRPILLFVFFYCFHNRALYSRWAKISYPAVKNNENPEVVSFFGVKKSKIKSESSIFCLIIPSSFI